MQKLADRIYEKCEDMDYLDYVDTKDEDIENLERELNLAKELHLDCILEALGCMVE